VNARAARINASSITPVCVRISKVRLGTQSTIKPPQDEINRVGIADANPTIPSVRSE